MQLANYEDRSVIETLRQTVAKDVTESEFLWFLQVCKSTGLNPLKREIWCIPGKRYQNKQGNWVQGAVQIMMGINGYLAIANSHPEFDGLETALELGADNKPISATCKVYRKDRSRPHSVTVYFDEFYRPGNTFDGKYTPGTWDKMPKVMIQKVAKAHALREAFVTELGGTYTEDEVEPPSIDVTEESAKIEVPSIAYDLESIAPEQVEDAKILLKKKGALYDQERGLWVTKERIKALAKYEVLS